MRFSGHSRRAILQVRIMLPAMKRAVTSRGHHSHGPTSRHPAMNSQNGSGGLWL
jgi:hypothetical protein